MSIIEYAVAPNERLPTDRFKFRLSKRGRGPVVYVVFLTFDYLEQILT
jgi:hypothetical protein